MIILLSKDFRPLAQALHKLYAEPVIELFDHPNWLHDLLLDNQGKFTSRLSIIGHSDSLYSDDQAYFGGNQHEKIMLLEEFSHLLMNLLKYNERLKPGFCRHLKKIDIIDCHIGERKFIARFIAEQFQNDAYLKEQGAHITIHSFANQHHPNAGSILMPHVRKSSTLSFYTFDSTQAYTQYKEVHNMLEEQKTALHHLGQIPGHTSKLTNGQNREEAIDQLQSQYEASQKKEHKLLKTHTQKKLHIADPRNYLDKHPECQITVAEATQPGAKKTKHSAHGSQSMFSKTSPAPHHHPSPIPHHKHTSYLEGSMFKQQPNKLIENESNVMTHRSKK